MPKKLKKVNSLLDCSPLAVRKTVQVVLDDVQGDDSLEFTLRSLSVGERMALVNFAGDESLPENFFTVRVISACLVDEEGNRLIVSDEARAKVGEWDASLVERLFAAAAKVIGLVGPAAEEPKKAEEVAADAVAEAAKN